MLVNPQPIYPLLIVDTKGWLGWHTDSQKIQFSLYGALNTKRWTGYDSSGAMWRVLPESFQYSDTWWTRLLANTIYNPRFEAELQWEALGQCTFEELQKTISSLVDRDDDILTQFIDRGRLKDIVQRCSSFDELTRKLRKMKIIRE